MSADKPYERRSLSLADVHASIAVPARGFLRRLLAFVGPGYLVAVGYMDPGNWATSVAGGSAFGYALLSAVLISSVMAILLQALAVRLGIATGRDLAQLCRERFPPAISLALWLLAEIAICATDLAELIGTAIALQLLFGIPLLLGVVLTALDALLILWLQHKGMRWLEALIIALIVLVTSCFVVEIALSQPVLAHVLAGYVPTTEIVRNPEMLYLAIGILGATVMPHNLYLHTSVVQSRRIGDGDGEKREAIRFATVDSTVALVLALFVNSAILILSAAVFHIGGETEVAELQEAYRLLAPMVGIGLASTLFAVALFASGVNATVTATLSGQVVMEGFLGLSLPMWLRRLVTRLVAIIPAVFITWSYGESGTAQLLILSQVILSLQLPFAVIPLLMFVTSRDLMGRLTAPRWIAVVGWACAALIVGINAKLLIDVITG
ncbi:MAG TPA: Nramp family divalent metal transporter [Alphaproteobacteria bacterium]|nr:Nramp family divalent metal transporter [Alphaproteobacteria bacterium]